MSFHSSKISLYDFPVALLSWNSRSNLLIKDTVPLTVVIELPIIKAGRKLFFSLQSQAELRHLEVFVRWADVVILVYSITDKASFHLAVQLLQQVQFNLNVL